MGSTCQCVGKLTLGRYSFEMSCQKRDQRVHGTPRINLGISGLSLS